MDDKHLIHEIQQITLIQQKLIKMLESNNNEGKPIQEAINELELVDSITKKVSEKLGATPRVSEQTFEWITHELRTPLVPILAYTEMLLSNHFGPLTEQQREKAEIIDASIKQLASTVNLLKDHLKVDSKNENLARQEIREIKQEKAILEKINQSLENKGEGKHDDVVKKRDHDKVELEQEKLLLNKAVKMEEEKNLHLGKKHVITVALSIAVIGVVITSYSIYITHLTGEQYRVPNLSASTGYVIQNLQGDTIDTWLSWRLVDGAVLHVNVPNAANYPGKMLLIKEVIESDEAIQIDDSLLHKGLAGSVSTYYVGWAGALKAASEKQTQFYIPDNFQVIDSPRGEGEITITLTDQRSGDGYSGYTKSIADEAQNQILKSEIIIYETANLSDEQFKTILRHEFGHALGLAHSTAPEDLMAPEITTPYPYISDCDIDAIVMLYDGGKTSQVVCEK